MIVDHDNQRVLEVLENRDKATVLAYLQQAKQDGLLAHVEEVTTDMWDAYVNATSEVFEGKVRVTIDRFHVMKNFQEQLTQARRQIQRGLDKEAAKELKGSRWLWVKNWENLTQQEQQELETLKGKFPQLKELAQQRESLRSIFEDTTIKTAEEGQKRLQELPEREW